MSFKISDDDYIDIAAVSIIEEREFHNICIIIITIICLL
jgi:hypothetical protein